MAMPDTSPDAPGFESLRWNEDYRYLSEKRRLSAYESLKYRPFELGSKEASISFGGSARGRVNVFDNDRFGLQGGRDGALWLLRFYAHSDIRIGERFRTFVEISSHFADGSGDLVPGPFDRDRATLSQVFVDWRRDTSRLRLGRQEMTLGSARLMALRDGSNVRLFYDGARWDADLGERELRVFYLQPVTVRVGVFDDSSRPANAIWGVNTNLPLARGKAEVYYLGLKRRDAVYTQGTDNEIRHSVGTRLFGEHNGWDWNVEALYQFGEFGDAGIRAWTVASIAGYRFSGARRQPRVAFSANVASGDRNPDDGRLQTFNPLFPNLAYFEEAAILAPQNFYNIEPEISWRLTPRLELALDWNFFWRLERNDAVYVRGLVPLPGTAEVPGHFVTHVPSISLDYQWNRHWSMDLSVSRFFAGEVIKNAGGDNVNFFKAQVEWKF